MTTINSLLKLITLLRDGINYMLMLISGIYHDAISMARRSSYYIPLDAKFIALIRDSCRVSSGQRRSDFGKSGANYSQQGESCSAS